MMNRVKKEMVCVFLYVFLLCVIEMYLPTYLRPLIVVSVIFAFLIDFIIFLFFIIVSPSVLCQPLSISVCVFLMVTTKVVYDTFSQFMCLKAGLFLSTCGRRYYLTFENFTFFDKVSIDVTNIMSQRNKENTLTRLHCGIQ